MASPENPRAASAAPTTRRAVLSKRVWQDLRRARALGDDGRGGSIALHGVQIYFAHKQQGIESQQAQHAQRQDDAARAARQVGGDDEQQQQQQHGENAKQRRQRRRMETYAKAIQHSMRLAFRRWRAAISIKSDDETMDDEKQQQQQKQQQQAPIGDGSGGGSSSGDASQLELSSEEVAQLQEKLRQMRIAALHWKTQHDHYKAIAEERAEAAHTALVATGAAPSTAMDDSAAAAGAPKRAHTTPPRPAAPAAGGAGGETPPAGPKKQRGSDVAAAIAAAPMDDATVAERQRRQLNEASETLAERSGSRGEGEGSRDGGGPSA